MSDEQESALEAILRNLGDISAEDVKAEIEKAEIHLGKLRGLYRSLSGQPAKRAGKKPGRRKRSEPAEPNEEGVES